MAWLAVPRGSERLDEAYVPVFGAFGAASDDAMVAHRNRNRSPCSVPEPDAAVVISGGADGARGKWRRHLKRLHYPIPRDRRPLPIRAMAQYTAHAAIA